MDWFDGQYYEQNPGQYHEVNPGQYHEVAPGQYHEQNPGQYEEEEEAGQYQENNGQQVDVDDLTVDFNHKVDSLIRSGFVQYFKARKKES